MDPITMSALIGAGSGMVGSGLDFWSSAREQAGLQDMNDKNLGWAREQMAWQERMSSTQYQRAVKDMKLAGLNPVLAATHGASVPGPVAMSFQPTGGTFQGVGSRFASNARGALEMAHTGKVIENLTTQNKILDSESRLKETEANFWSSRKGQFLYGAKNVAETIGTVLNPLMTFGLGARLLKGLSSAKEVSNLIKVPEVARVLPNIIKARGR